MKLSINMAKNYISLKNSTMGFFEKYLKKKLKNVKKQSTFEKCKNTKLVCSKICFSVK